MANNTSAPDWRADFPALRTPAHGKPVAFLDSAASAQKPRAVLDAMEGVMYGPYANIHRGLYEFSQKTTGAFEAARKTVASFIGAGADEIIFTRNATEGFNLVASSFGLKSGDEVILTVMEHHANMVPWHLMCERAGIDIKYIPVADDGTLDIAALDGLLSDKTKIVSFTHVSNALGTINPVADIIKKVRTYNKDIAIMIDGAQSVPHMPVDVAALDCDFFAFTGHKLYGPNGIGVLWGKKDALAALNPYQGGGDMIERVTLDGSTYKPAPAKFEAGTPAIAEAIGLAAACDYITSIGWDAIMAYEDGLKASLMDALQTRGDARLIGTADARIGVASFVMDGIHTSDIAMVLDQCGVAVRTGHHCCMPLMDRFGIEGTVRASLGLYSTQDDIDVLMAGLDKAKGLLA